MNNEELVRLQNELNLKSKINTCLKKEQIRLLDKIKQMRNCGNCDGEKCNKKQYISVVKDCIDNKFNKWSFYNGLSNTKE